MNDFPSLLERARVLVDKFAEHDAKPWSSSDKMLDLSAHAGDLAQAVMEREGLKPKGNADIETEVGVILFILFDISRTYGIDLGAAFEKFIESAEKSSA